MKKHLHWISWCSLLLAVIVSPSTIYAQSQATTGIIRGKVLDPQDRPVSGAVIVLRELSTNFQRTIRTQSNGAFAASLLPLGTYEVVARAVGFQEVRQPGVVVRVGEMVNLQLRLGEAVVLEAIQVEGALPVVDVSQSEAATRLPTEAVSGLPNNGRNFLNLTLLTPNVAIVQGPDGDELSIAGQRGIHNNISVDGADFNNPFFGEQRGGQRPAFTFNLDAVQEIVVVSDGANAESGRSGGGFVNVITKSGTNELHGSVHYFGKYDALSADANHLNQTLKPDFQQHQFGFTLGGPLIRDKAFFFVAYDQQLFDDTRQTNPLRISNTGLRTFMDTAFGGALAGDFLSIKRTNDARAALAKFDFRLGNRHNLSLKYNFTWSEQKNGTFDVDVWARSANAREKDRSHAINGSLLSVLSSQLTNEFRFQWAREDRPRPYNGPRFANGRPFPDTGADFANGFRWGMPFFIPVRDHDTRVQLLDNVTFATGDHIIKFGAEWNRTETVQTFIGFANGRFIFSSVDGFMNYVANGNGYVECSDGSSSTVGSCPAGTTITGPVVLYLQQAGVGGRSVEDAGTQSIVQHDVAVFLQDSWKPHPNLTLNYGLRWEAQVEPSPITPPADVFFAPFIGQTASTTAGTFRFPSNGRIPNDLDMFQPRFGFAWDVKGTGRTVIRGSAGLYYARIPGLNLASVRSTNGSIGQTIFRNSELTNVLGAPPNYDQLLAAPSGVPVLPDVFVFDKDFSNPRTFSATFGFEQEIQAGVAGFVNYTHARTDNLTRFVNRNDPVFGSPWGSGLDGPGGPGTNGINTLTVVESSAKSRYNGITVGFKRLNDRNLQFQANYTVSWDKSDDDNERDPFSFRYAVANNFGPEYNWSNRDQRHRLNVWVLARLPGDVMINNRLSAYSAQPTSEACGPGNVGNGQRAVVPQDRICANGTILKRNTLRKDNAFFSWDIRVSRPIRLSGNTRLEAIFEVFNVTNTDNFRDPVTGGLLFNFDGTVRSGLGAPRQAQVGARVIF